VARLFFDHRQQDELEIAWTEHAPAAATTATAATPEETAAAFAAGIFVAPTSLRPVTFPKTAAAMREVAQVPAETFKTMMSKHRELQIST
jgi:hypothetical protein